MKRALALALLVTSACALVHRPAWELPPPPACLRSAFAPITASFSISSRENGSTPSFLSSTALCNAVVFAIACFWSVLSAGSEPGSVYGRSNKPSANLTLRMFATASSTCC